MGAWGHKALESDNGLDVVNFLEDYIASEYPNINPVDLTLSELISRMKSDGFFGKDFNDIDYFYDHSAMALTELYLMFKENGEIDFDHEDEICDLNKRVKSFSGDEASFEFLLQYLMDIKNEVPHQDGEREVVELWKDSLSFEDWKDNLDYLINEIKTELKK